MRGFADGVVSVLLASYLSAIGFSPLQIGAIATGTLLGSAVLTLAVGFAGARLHPRQILLISATLMALTGIGFATITAFWPLLLVAVIGTLNPFAGDVSVFLPVEQALLPETVAPRRRTALFARYSWGAVMLGALGALASGVPAALAHRNGWNIAAAERSGFVAYSAIAALAGCCYARLSPALGSSHRRGRGAPLVRSRRIVFKLAALFSLDALGGGFIVQSLLALWLFRRFNLSIQTAGAVFFVGGLLASFSQLVSARLATRLGLIRTIVVTHLPSSVLIAVAALMPSAPLAIAVLLVRMSLSQMDTPPRQSYVMAVVPPEERPAAASITNVPRSLASATTPLLTGAMLNATSFGWPLICAGATKALYDLLLLHQFQGLKPPEEVRS
jgi:MFS family permease